MTSFQYPSAPGYQQLLSLTGVAIGAGTTISRAVTIPNGVQSVAILVQSVVSTGSAGWAHFAYNISGGISGKAEYSRCHAGGTGTNAPTVYLDVLPGSQTLSITEQSNTPVTANIIVLGYNAPVAAIKPPKPSYTMLHEWFGFETSYFNLSNGTYASVSCPTSTVNASAAIMLLGLDVDVSGYINPGSGGGGSIQGWEILVVGGYSRAGQPAFRTGQNDVEPYTTLASPGWATPQYDTNTVAQLGGGTTTESQGGPTSGAPYPGGLFSAILKSGGPSWPAGVNKHITLKDLEVPMVPGDNLWFHMAAQTGGSGNSNTAVDGEMQINLRYAVL
jgi:hypothetical protein